MKRKVPCLVLAFESAIGCGKNMEVYYKYLLNSDDAFPVMVYTDAFAFNRAPGWIKNKIIYSIPKTTHEPKDCDKYFCNLSLTKHRSRTLWNDDCIKFVIYLRHVFGENTIWIIDTTFHEIEKYMGRYIVQVFHTELFSVHSYFNSRSAYFFKNYWLIFVPGYLLKKLVMMHCRISKKDSRLQMIGRVLDDSIHDSSLQKEKILREFHLNRNNKTVLYAPTWESTKIWPIGKKEHDLNNLLRFYEFARLNNLNVVLRPHPISMGHFNVKKVYLESIQNLRNIYFDDTTHSSIYGPNKSLLIADILITDLSSIAIDFMSLGKPVIFLYPQKKFGLWDNFPSFAKVNRISYTARSFGQLFYMLNFLLYSKESVRRITRRKKFVSLALSSIEGKSGLLFNTILHNHLQKMSPFDFISIPYIKNYMHYLYKMFVLTRSKGLLSLINKYFYNSSISDYSIPVE